MKHLSIVALGILLLAVPAAAQDKPAAKPSAPKSSAAKAPAAKTLSATGVVSAVTGDSLSVKGKDATWTFAVDKDTHVRGTGASHKTAALKNDQKPTQITEYVKVGDSVTVKFHDGATKHATDVLVRSSVPGKK